MIKVYIDNKRINKGLEILKEIISQQNNGNGDLYLEATIINPIEEDLYELSRYEYIEEMCEKISKQPIYKKYLNIVCEENYTSCHIAYNFSTKQIEIFGYECEDALSIDKYGIEWAFSKEELKDE